MRKIDLKHAVFHVVVGIYFLWLIVYGVLLFMASSNALNEFPNLQLNEVLRLWIILNLIMGTVLFIVIRKFRNRTLLNRVIMYSFVFLLGVSAGVFYLVAKI